MRRVYAIVISPDEETLLRIQATLKRLKQETHMGTSLDELESLLDAQTTRTGTLVILDLPRMRIAEVATIAERVFSRSEEIALFLIADGPTGRDAHLLPKRRGTIMWVRKPVRQSELRDLLRMYYEPIIG